MVDNKKIALIIFFIGIILDQLTKFLAKNLTKTIMVFKNFEFSLVYNKGIAFGIFQGTQIISIIIAVVIIGIISALLYREKYNIIETFGLTLILTGATGNLIDRIFLDQVIDFISIGWFAVFNLADIMLCLGGALLVYEYVIKDIEKKIVK